MASGALVMESLLCISQWVHREASPYVQVALAGDGHYVQLAQHVHHVMDHINE